MERSKRPRPRSTVSSQTGDESDPPSTGDENDPPNSVKRTRKEAKLLSQPSMSSSELMMHNELVNRPGKILRMQLTNFMCHSNFRIDFHSRINFIVGSNGSGKSAILAALVMGLGSTARSTNRSANMKQLIKIGENSAKIEITLGNEGEYAFEPDTYGNSITVVRSINKNSCSSYVLKSARGQVVSRKVDDLHRILLYFNIQVDNPVFVLNQDGAREFLREMDPSKNYKLFLKASQIDMIMEKLNDCLSKHRHHVQQLTCYNQKLATDTQYLNELREDFELLSSIQTLNETLSRYDLERAWNAVARCEIALEIPVNKISKISHNRDGLRAEISNLDEIEVELRVKLKEMTSSLTGLRKSRDVTSTQLLELSERAEAARSTRERLDVEYKGIMKKLGFLEQQNNALRSHIELNSQQSTKDMDGLRLQNENSLMQLRKEYEDYMAKIESLHRDVKLSSDNKSQNDAELRSIQNQKRTMEEALQRLSSMIAGNRPTRRQTLEPYGANMSMLVAEIDKAFMKGKFVKMPRGPFGRYIEVANAAFRDVVEAILGGVMRSFVVDNLRDRQLLMQLISHFLPNQNITVITSRFQSTVYNVRQKCVEPPPDTYRLMDVIRCSDPIVMNCLIDRAQVERILVTERKEVAENHTSIQSNVPNNLLKIICGISGMKLDYYPEPFYRLYSTKLHKAVLLKSDTDDRIKNLETEKIAMVAKINEADAELKHLHILGVTMSKSINEKRALASQLMEARESLIERIRELEDIEYPEESKVEVLKRELEDNNKKARVEREKLSSTEAHRNAAIERDGEIALEVTALESELTEALGTMAQLELAVDRMIKKVRSVVEAKCHKTEELETLAVKLSEFEEEKVRKLRSIAAATAIAADMGERYTTERTDEEIELSIQELKKKIKKRKEISYTQEELREMIERTERVLREDRTNHRNIRRCVRTLKESIVSRYSYVKRLRNHMALMLQFVFSNLMQLRNFDGSIDVDHDEQLLHIRVVPRDRDIQNAVASARALSGGERSFTTVVYLIALWSCVDHPFFCLDEYDVFTDEVNREFMTRLLIKEGTDRLNRQFTFLTPLDLTMNSTDIIKIHRLASAVNTN